MRWLLWFAYFLLLSAALLMPHPARMANQLIDSDETRFTASKSVHVTAYAVFAVLSSWLPLRTRQRWMMLAFLSVHACGTEYLQTFVPERGGAWQDVTLNHTGLYLGILVSWRWWSAPLSAGDPAQVK